ncbi:NADH dehydrogenase subunit 6 (mitochondrion) [Priapulus caudatus]|uniref:NADH-ubiquinone oxidoreductase chain 6 n=1 Tax=Priapulus caudatus TaxID=37621 RepID=A0MCU1_PRICU|nr:NADH dehydrogenase subunit 6 [Priapulus caudatus]ABE03636.1 NADH dehydrogenase subunit 6 [Priapulus caudatus]
MTKLLLILMFLFIFYFSFCTHPLLMVLIIMINTCLSCILLGTLQFSFWFSYVLFLVFLGGLLILFLYISSLASNETFNLKFLLTPFLSSLLIMILVSMNNEMSMDSVNSEFKCQFNSNLISTLTYSLNSVIFVILIMTYLLITLMAVVKISQLGFGPLRQWKYDTPHSQNPPSN